MVFEPKAVRVENRWQRLLKCLFVTGMAVSVTACSTLGASGPSAGDVLDADKASYQANGIQIVELDGAMLDQLARHDQSSTFSEVFGESEPSQLLIGRGDILDIAIWEAPPAVLFGATATDLQFSANPQAARSASIPQQIVGDEGEITVPFVGPISVVERRPAEVEKAIVEALRGRAHDPQVVVRLVQNEARTVTVLGEVAQSARVPLTARGERLLDALATAGGTREPVDRSIIQLTRGADVSAMPLLSVIKNPTQNVRLRPDDVVTILHEPFSFVALGAIRNSAEIPFDGAGLTLAQALGRAGGLNDNRANIRGVFVFRLEDPEALNDPTLVDMTATADGRVPVIYRLDLSDPASLFAMQDFAIRDDDVLYVSTAPGADLQRFVSTISSAAFSVIGITNAIQSSN
ncbi:MAG: polysaccharide biosynthesis/export family protein [Pseudomonadota bacterium]